MAATRDSLRLQLYRLLNTSADDDAQVEFDVATYDTAYALMDEGRRDAQQYMISIGRGDHWAKTGTLTVPAQAAAPNPPYTIALPTDFLRLDGDENVSGLRSSTGPWGVEILMKHRHNVRGDFFYIKGTDICTAEGATPPSPLYIDYLYEPTSFASSATVDFPDADSELIPAFAAVRAVAQGSWYTGDTQDESRLLRHLDHCKTQAYRRGRASRQPRQASPRQMLGDHWI